MTYDAENFLDRRMSMVPEFFPNDLMQTNPLNRQTSMYGYFKEKREGFHVVESQDFDWTNPVNRYLWSEMGTTWPVVTVYNDDRIFWFKDRRAGVPSNVIYRQRVETPMPGWMVVMNVHEDNMAIQHIQKIIRKNHAYHPR